MRGKGGGGKGSMGIKWGKERNLLRVRDQQDGWRRGMERKKKKGLLQMNKERVVRYSKGKQQ